MNSAQQPILYMDLVSWIFDLPISLVRSRILGNSTADRSLTGCLVTNIRSESGKGEIFSHSNFLGIVFFFFWFTDFIWLEPLPKPFREIPQPIGRWQGVWLRISDQKAERGKYSRTAIFSQMWVLSFVYLYFIWLVLEKGGARAARRCLRPVRRGGKQLAPFFGGS